MTIREAIDRLGSTEMAINHAMDDCGRRAIDLVHEGFDAKRDPYGVSWKDTKEFQRPFENRDGMDFRGSFTVAPQHLGFIVRSSHPAAAYQHHGTDHIPARPVVPDDRGLPDRWQADFEAIITSAIKRHLEP